MKEDEKALWENKRVTPPPPLLHHLLLLRLIAVNRADGVQWHLREGFIEVRVGV